MNNSSKKAMNALLYAGLLPGPLALLSTDAMAQFGKFDTETTVSSPSKAPPRQKVKEQEADDLQQEEGTADYFGRGTGIQGAKKGKDEKKFVNLNPETAFGPEVIESFDFPDASLQDLTMHMQKLTGINLILDKELKGRVSIVAPTAITVGDAWKAYLTALNMNGYSIIKSGQFYKVVNARDIRYTTTKIYTGSYTPNTENYVMRILPLKHISATEVVRSVRPFASRFGRILPLKQTNTIIILDTGTNINRVARLIQFVDVPGHEESLQIIPVKNSSAQEIAKLIEKIIVKGNSRSSRRTRSSSTQGQNISKIIAEPRTNSIIAMANGDGAKQLRELVTQLDVRLVSANSGQIHVYYLNHGNSEELSKTLSALVSNAQPKQSANSRFSRRNDSGPSLFANQVKIQADKGNNALVVTASPTDYLTIKEVIKKLDIPRDQVYVEAMIMETSIGKNNRFGITLSSIPNGIGSTTANLGSDFVNLLSGNVLSLGGLFAGGGIGKKVEVDLGGTKQTVRTVTGLIRALASDGNTNVLATPQILAYDNTEATFEVGEKIPIPELQTASNGTTSTTIKRENVTLKIKLTPQINKVTRFVKMKMEQSINDVSGRALPADVARQAVGITTRNTNTTIVVRDRDTMAMGGLMRDKTIDKVDKVPFLGDIPILGWLFKEKRREIEKVNLLMFLTPKIMDSYQATTAQTVKDLLNRRGAHLKKALGEQDPFGNTVKGLYQKVHRQEQGPLYDTEESKKFQDSNAGPGISEGKKKAMTIKSAAPKRGKNP